jgi:hypothetical protein
MGGCVKKIGELGDAALMAFTSAFKLPRYSLGPTLRSYVELIIAPPDVYPVAVLAYETVFDVELVTVNTPL